MESYKYVTDEMPRQSDTATKKATQTVGAAAAGAALGYGTVTAAGMTAAGMVGSGAGVGAAAGPVGAVAGAVAGLAAFGVYKLFASDNNAGLSAEQQERIQKVKSAHEKGFMSDEAFQKALDEIINA